MLPTDETEVRVRIPYLPNAEDDVLSILAEHGINVLALSSYAVEDKLVVLLVPDNPRLAKQALISAGIDCHLDSIVSARLQNRIGSMAQLGNRLKAAGVEILYSYASYTESEEIYAVFKTDDNVLALDALRQNAA
jgi:hypothetical protein